VAISGLIQEKSGNSIGLSRFLMGCGCWCCVEQGGFQGLAIPTGLPNEKQTEFVPEILPWYCDNSVLKTSEISPPSTVGQHGSLLPFTPDSQLRKTVEIFECIYAEVSLLKPLITFLLFGRCPALRGSSNSSFYVFQSYQHQGRLQPTFRQCQQLWSKCLLSM
jgi:hypothetical protein